MVNTHKIKQDICDIGRRIYNKGFAAANDGNITVRISENEFLCTPTMHSKGFLKPDDICTIDFTGKQLAGRKKRSSEALLHLEIYRKRDDIKLFASGKITTGFNMARAIALGADVCYSARAMMLATLIQARASSSAIKAYSKTPRPSPPYSLETVIPK